MSIDINREIIISLTGENSHKISIPRGQGSFSIGTRGISEGKYDVRVEKDSVINWNAFNEFYIGGDQKRKAQAPYGDWPRWFYYSGSDTGFIEWSFKRKIEEFHWAPGTDAAVDFTNADICRLYIHTKDNKIQILTGERILFLTLSGTLENFDIKEGVKIPCLTFCPDCLKETTSYQLPVYKALAQATSVHINNTPAGAAFDCAGLLQFQNLRSLDLNGNMTNLGVLAELKNLESIGLRYIPDLQGMPKLESWHALKSFIGYNIEENAGKTLRTELNKLKKEKIRGYSSVTKLRKRIWFDTEYGIPFSDWEEKNAAKATKAYKSCYNKIKKSETEEEVHGAIIEFVEKINRLKDIETTEREDVGTAISLLAENSSLEIAPEKWRLWFDEARDF